MALVPLRGVLYCRNCARWVLGEQETGPALPVQLAELFSSKCFPDFLVRAYPPSRIPAVIGEKNASPAFYIDLEINVENACASWFLRVESPTPKGPSKSQS